jgi:hypothetical protein
MKVRNAHAEAQPTGMGANFAVADAGSTTKPAAMAVDARDDKKILKNFVADPR